MNREQLIYNLKNYNKLKGYIENINLDIKELELELGPNGVSGEEKVQATNKFSSITETQAIDLMQKKYELEVKREKQEIVIKKIDNAINTLPKNKGDVVRCKYIYEMTWVQIGAKLSFQPIYCMELRKSAIEEMLKIINNEI